LIILEFAKFLLIKGIHDYVNPHKSLDISLFRVAVVLKGKTIERPCVCQGSLNTVATLKMTTFRAIVVVVLYSINILIKRCLDA